MEPVEVIARFDPQGKVIPLRFIYKDHTHSVDSIGRRWQDERGQHILVMVPGGAVYELCFHPAESRWEIGQPASRRTLA